MRSSGSTRKGRDRPIRLGVIVLGDDDARACTGRRLIRLGLARRLAGGASSGPRPVVLDPGARTPLSAADRRAAERGGLVAVDCSWNALKRRSDLLPAEHGPSTARLHRRLPFLIAANPQHYGRLAELNTAEALGAALSIVGRGDEGERLLAGFAGGPAFFELNHDRLRRYAAVADGAGVERAERELFGTPESGRARSARG